MGSSDFRDLLIWQQSMDIATDMYQLTKSLPKEERYGLCDQMRRCAVSIPSNIAEGQSRNSVQEFIRFLYISRGSLAELRTQLEICLRVGYCNDIEDYMLKMKAIDKMIISFISRLKK